MMPRSQTATGYAIVANPVSGGMTVEKKKLALAGPAKILRAPIFGLDTRAPAEFDACARALAGRCGVLVVAGGDGTFSQVINAVDTTRQPVAYLPLGSGNAMRHALGYRGGLNQAALRIRNGRIRSYDLIDCGGGRRAYNASIGAEGCILALRDRYLKRGRRGFTAYAGAVCRVFSGRFRPYGAELRADHGHASRGFLMSLMVMKEPYYGYGMNMVPRARFDDGLLHVLAVSPGTAGLAATAVSAFLGGNRRGRYRTCRSLKVKLDRQLTLQADGNTAWASRDFTFTLLPGALKIKC
jgi:diacylglycerol kinase family enzyme